MQRDTAKLAITRHALRRLANGNISFVTHKDLFHPGDWQDDRKVADVAAQRTWQKSVLQTLVDIRILAPSASAERGDGFQVIDAGWANKLYSDNEAMYWLLTPREFDPPSWVKERLPKEPEEEAKPQAKVPPPSEDFRESVEAFAGMLKTVSEQLTAIQSSYRRIEDRLSKADHKAAEAREKTLQLVASATADVRKCSVDLQSSVEALGNIALDLASRQEHFLQGMDAHISNLTTKMASERAQFVAALDLNKRYSDITARIAEFNGALEPLRSTMRAMTTAASSLEAGVETAMEMAREIEVKQNGAH